uniref:Uncharacterized protein n=1 Tax=Eutreptiella gymnastica TaxID=73025 RepID=A0A7S4G7F3_9EUGL
MQRREWPLAYGSPPEKKSPGPPFSTVLQTAGGNTVTYTAALKGICPFMGLHLMFVDWFCLLFAHPPTLPLWAIFSLSQAHLSGSHNAPSQVSSTQWLSRETGRS